jgi:hypothetical protein
MALAARHSAPAAALCGRRSGHTRQVIQCTAVVALFAEVTGEVGCGALLPNTEHGVGVHTQAPRFWQRRSRCVAAHGTPHELDPHAVLGVSRSAGRADIRAAYYARLQEVRCKHALQLDIGGMSSCMCAHCR